MRKTTSTTTGFKKIPVTLSSMKSVQKHTKDLKEETMHRINSMGFERPKKWVN